MRHSWKLKLPAVLLGAALSLSFVSGASAQTPGQWHGQYRHHWHGHHHGSSGQVQGYVYYGQSQGGHRHRHHHHRWGGR